MLTGKLISHILLLETKCLSLMIEFRLVGQYPFLNLLSSEQVKQTSVARQYKKCEFLFPITN